MPQDPDGAWLTAALDACQERHQRHVEALNARYQERAALRPDQQAYAGLMGSLTLSAFLALAGVLLSAALLPALMVALLMAAGAAATLLWCALNPALNPRRARRLAAQEWVQRVEEERARYNDDLRACLAEYRHRVIGARPRPPLAP